MRQFHQSRLCVSSMTPTIPTLFHLLWPIKGRAGAEAWFTPSRLPWYHFSLGHLTSPHALSLGSPSTILTSYSLPLAVPRDYLKRRVLEGKGPATLGKLHRHMPFPKIYLVNYFLYVFCIPTAPSAQVTVQQTRQGC